MSLTRRELEVLQLLSEGRSNAEISRVLEIGSGTTKKHLVAIYQKLEVTNRTQAATKAMELQLVSHKQSPDMAAET